jgi:tRNA threonylcarbamoyladenosine biosynthesis protein TsaB
VSLGLPGRGVSTLDALGAGIAAAGAPAECLAVLDGYRGETLWEPAVMRPEELAKRLDQVSEAPSVAGSGAIRFRHELEGAGGIRIPDDADPVHRVAARHICASAAAGKGSESLEPIYLRPPDAERWRERDSFQRAD